MASKGLVCAVLGPSSSGLQQSARSRTFVASHSRRTSLRPGRLQVVNIAAPARQPLSIPSLVPDEALIDEVRGQPVAQCRRK